MKEQLYNFIRQHKLAVVAYMAGEVPQSALVGIAVTPGLEIVFDALDTSRKYEAILRNPTVSLVIGWDNETTVQYEGEACLLTVSKEDIQLKDAYFSVYPDGRERAATWKGLVHFRVKPAWIRYSNFNAPVQISEMTF